MDVNGQFVDIWGAFLGLLTSMIHLQFFFIICPVRFCDKMNNCKFKQEFKLV